MSKKQDKKLMLIPKEIDITEVKKDLRNVFRNHPKLIEKIRKCKHYKSRIDTINAFAWDLDMWEKIENEQKTN